MSDSGLAVTFHTGVHDTALHGLRVLRKSLTQGLGVLVVGPSAVIDLIDEQLWTAEPGSFIPHARIEPASQGAESGSRADAACERLSTVWLLSHEGDAAPVLPAGRPLLLNLGCPVPSTLDGFSRIVEVVGASPQARAQGQVRWREYRARGHNPSHHAV